MAEWWRLRNEYGLTPFGAAFLGLVLIAAFAGVLFAIEVLSKLPEPYPPAAQTVLIEVRPLDYTYHDGRTERWWTVVWWDRERREAREVTVDGEAARDRLVGEVGE